MITKMTGTLVRIVEDEARLSIGPLEYQILLAESVRRQLMTRIGQEVTFHIQEYLEGTPNGNRFTPRRIGFLSESEIDLFEMLCTVDKIGVKKALKAMARPTREIAAAIQRQDSRWLSILPGVGLAMAEAICQKLKRKVLPLLSGPDDAAPVATPSTGEPETAVAAPVKKSRKKAEPAPEPAISLPSGQLVDDIYQTLMAVGLNPIEAQSKLDALLQSGKPFATVEEALLLVYSRG
jgi:Holliday junction DNA helicase RuvA